MRTKYVKERKRTTKTNSFFAFLWLSRTAASLLGNVLGALRRAPSVLRWAPRYQQSGRHMLLAARGGQRRRATDQHALHNGAVEAMVEMGKASILLESEIVRCRYAAATRYHY